MGVSTQLQGEPLPALPFRVISGTIGCGAYAFVRKACPSESYTPVVAVKFIHKEHAFERGRIKPKQLHTEVALHAHIGKHPNIIEFLNSSEDDRWVWIVMELADGGDLFDKVDPDVGVGEEVAHFYFTQLISAISFSHSKGVAHRDLKPENILLSDGNLKLADFGLATLFRYQGKTKQSTSICGSPPYMAPELAPRAGTKGSKIGPYDPSLADIWSSGIVLFVLLVGNTPWDDPTTNSPEFADYCNDDYMQDELWTRIPKNALSLIRGMLNVDPKQRFSLEDVRRHPWYTQPNALMDAQGFAANPVGMATKMLERLRIDFNADPTLLSQKRHQHLSQTQAQNPLRTALTQPMTPVWEKELDWETLRISEMEQAPMSQPVAPGRGELLDFSQFGFDAALSQFSQNPAVPMSVTQLARKFNDVLPEQSLARFLSFMDWGLLLPKLSEALTRLGVPVAPFSASALQGLEQKVMINIKTEDERKCLLAGTIVVEKHREEVLSVRFSKRKGDPLEWRRLFKQVAVLCKDGLYRD